MHQNHSRMRILLSLVGLTAVAASLALNFLAPLTIWNWVFLLLALALLFASRRF